MLDNTEMALELIDGTRTTTAKNTPRKVTLKPVESPEFLAELCSAAGMIMDREECEAVVNELLLAQHPHPAAA